MSTLAHIFEAEGIATVALASVRKQVENARPPRGLLCDFPLGRPLGKPDDPAFQTRVLQAAFALLRSEQPLIAEYAEAVAEGGDQALACPLPPRSNADEPAVVAEIRGLRAAYDRAIASYGNRAGTGRVVGPDQIEDAIGAFARVAQGTPWKEAGVPGIPARVAQDIRGYYEMAALGLSDHVPSAWSGTSWFFEQTQAGKIILAARAAMRDAEVKRPIWFYMAPGDR